MKIVKWFAFTLYVSGTRARYSVDVTISHTGSSLEVKFTSGADEGIVNEGWSFGAVTIYALN